MNEATASVLRTAVKCTAVLILFAGWPKFGKTHVLNQTIVSDETRHDEQTLEKVRKVLWEYDPNGDRVAAIISALQNEGILFRERV